METAYIMRNGKIIGSPNTTETEKHVELTQAEYDALSEEEKDSDTIYFITDAIGGGGSSLYVVTGSLNMETEDNPVTLNQTFEEIKAAYDEGKTIIADILVAGEAQYIFNLLYILEDAIAFEWINSAAKVGGQINLMNDNTITFTMTSLEGGASEPSEDEVKLIGKVSGYLNSTGAAVDMTIEPATTPAELDELIKAGKKISLRLYENYGSSREHWYDLEYNGAAITEANIYYFNAFCSTGYDNKHYIIEALCSSLVTPNWKASKKVVGDIPQNGTKGQVLVKSSNNSFETEWADVDTLLPEDSGSGDNPYCLRCVISENTTTGEYKLGVSGVSTSEEDKDWFRNYWNQGKEVILNVSLERKPEGGSSTTYSHSLRCMKAYYMGSKIVAEFTTVSSGLASNEPEPECISVILKCPDKDNPQVNADSFVEFRTYKFNPDSFVITGNYDIEYTADGDIWTVSNIDKTFDEINQAITSNQSVSLKIYPVGDTTNPYILYPTMHYSEMGTAFALSLCDTDQVLGLSVMITKDNQVTASKTVHDFEELFKDVPKIKTIDVPLEYIYSSTTSSAEQGKFQLATTGSYFCAGFYIKKDFFDNNNIDATKLLNLYFAGSGSQGGYIQNIGRYGMTDIWYPQRSKINTTFGAIYEFSMIIFAKNGNSGDASTTWTMSSCTLRYEV